jgi:hypothetical protein
MLGGLLLVALLAGCGDDTRTVTCHEVWDADPATPMIEIEREVEHEIVVGEYEVADARCQSYCNQPDGGDWCYVVDPTGNWFGDVTAP